MTHPIPSNQPETLRGETSASRTIQTTRPATVGNTGRTFPVLTHGRGHSNHPASVLCITEHYSGATSEGDAVAKWLAGGDPEQQEITSVEVGGYRERSSFDFNRPPACQCCDNALPEGHYPVRVQMAETETDHAFNETVEVCGGCVGGWKELEAKL